MTTSGAGTDALASNSGRAIGWAYAGVAVLDVALRTAPWWRGHTFLGVQEYDDGVYYAASSLLLRGQLPYRDVVLVHPPGSTLLLAPFAGIGRLLGDPVGIGCARVAVVALSVGILVLLRRLAAVVCPERPTAAGLTACLLYAVLPGAVVSERTVLLEPMAAAPCLLAVLLVTRPGRRRAAAAGALLALGLAVKLFAGAYLVVVVVWLLWQRRADVASLLAGIADGAAVTLLPFALAAPGPFWHDVVVTQLHRPTDATLSGTARLAGSWPHRWPCSPPRSYRHLSAPRGTRPG